MNAHDDASVVDQGVELAEGLHGVGKELANVLAAGHVGSHRQGLAAGGGTVITFELDAPEGRGKERAFEVLDKLSVIDISNNLGDSKSLITHPATTTHRAMGPEGRAAIGLGDGVVRISVGLEGTEDLIADLAHALG